MVPDVKQYFLKGLVIPALPLALKGKKSIDEKYQRALLRYYISAGAGGIAAAVHTTQFEIRKPEIQLFKPLLSFVKDVLDTEFEHRKVPFVKIAGICGKREQAVSEAEYAAQLGYDLGLVSLGALSGENIDALIEHCRGVSEIIPVMGFYLQPAVGGRVLPYEFWRRFFEIDNVLAVKIAPFNRYQTIDVVRALAMSGRENEIVLYTGNDDNIILDLLTPYRIVTGEGVKEIRIKGGLLGQWSVWTKTAVDLLRGIHTVLQNGNDIPQEYLQKNIELTDANAAIFDAANNFSGCIAGIHEILFRQGLLRSTACLNPDERLSAGQSEAIDRVIKEYPWLPDDSFINEHLDEWLRTNSE